MLSYYNTNWIYQKSPPTANDFVVTYNYDLMGRSTSVVGGGQTVSMGYDQLSRMTSQITTLGEIDYKYDVAGNRTKMTWPDSFYVTYDYNAANDLWHIYESDGSGTHPTLATLSYDDLGRRKEIDRGNGANTTFTYTGAWLTTLGQTVDAPNSQILTFTNNASGQFTSRTSNNSAYSWDEGYDLDRTYTPNGQNQLTTAGSVALGYDGLGNLNSDGVNTYVYDPESRLTSVSGAASATLGYDPLGRLFKTTGSSTTKYLYDGSDLVAETDSGGTTVLRRYVHGPDTDEIIAWYEGSGTSSRKYLVADERGSITAVTDDTGAATILNSYDEYGLPGSTNSGRFQYTGQSWLSDIGLYYYKARIYSPVLGRFMQTDPSGFDQGLNLYAYADNDPANHIDPTGLGSPAVAGNQCPNAGAGGGGANCPTQVEEVVVIGNFVRPAPPGVVLSPDANTVPQLILASNITVQAPQGNRTLTCYGVAKFSAVGPLPQAAGETAFAPGTHPANGTVAIPGASTFGFGRRALRNGAAGAIQITPSGLGDLLRATGGPQPPYSVGDYGDANIRNAPGVRFDIYRFDTLKGARQFGTRTVATTITVPAGGHCPPGFTAQ